jgi:hypothetical protein
MAKRKPIYSILLAIVVVAAFLLVPATPSSASSHSDTQFYAAYEANNGGTTIFLKLCGSGAKYRFRTQTMDTHQALWDQTYNNSVNGCLGFWYRALTGGQPGHQFRIYSMYLDRDVTDHMFLDRARQDICTIQSANSVSCIRQIRTSPEMYIDQPTQGATVQGNVVVSGWAVDRTALSDSGVSEVQIFLDNQYLGNAQYGSAHQGVADYMMDSRFLHSAYSFSFNSANYSNGTKTLRVSSKSSVAGSWENVERQITINNVTSPPANIDPNTPAQNGPANNSSHGGSSITLSWQDTGDPDNKPRNFRDYEVEIWKQDNSWRTAWQVPTSVNVVLPSSGSYSWRVRSGDGTGASPWSPSWNFTVSIPIPAPIPTPTPPVTNVPFFWQGDPRWANLKLGACGYPCNTIGPCGCTLTSTAMVFAYYGVNHNPGTLSQCMGNSACPLYWGVAASCSAGKAAWVGQVGFSWARLDQELNQQKRPVVIGMRKGSNTHFVVAISGSGSNGANYTINDPGHKGGQGTKLSAFSNNGWSLETISIYRSTQSKLVIEHPNMSQLGSTLSDQGLAAEKQPDQTYDQPAHLPDQEIAQTNSSNQASIYRLDTNSMILELTKGGSKPATHMLIWSDTFSNTIWQEFSAYVQIPNSNKVFVRFRDAQGGMSDTISLSRDPVASPPADQSSIKIFLPRINKQR